MAIIFDKEVSQTELLSSHDDNIVKFHSDNVLAEVSCKVDFGFQSYDITPDPTGLFTYNLKEVVKVAINPSNFRDSVEPDVHNGNYSLQDDNAYLAVSVTYQISFEGGSTESISRNYKFVKGVKQPIKYLNNTIDTVADMITILAPFEKNSRKSFFIPYFDGYPMDFAFYSNAARNIIVTNKTTNHTATIPVLAGVNRVFISGGDHNMTLDDFLPLVYGVNKLELAIEGSPLELVTLNLDRRRSECGLCFKYHNEQGGWNYYRFNEIYREDTKTKTIASLAPLFASIEESFESDVISGKDSARTVSLLAEVRDKREQKYLQQILTSPRVELYLNEVFERADSSSWLGIRVLDGTFRTENTKNSFSELKIKVGITNKSLSL